jgi:hypothetical protein
VKRAETPAKNSHSRRAQENKTRAPGRGRTPKSADSSRKTARSAWPTAAAAPGAELAPSGRRDARRRWAAENDGHLIHGVNSRKRSLFLVPIRREMRAAILSDTGHNGDDPPARALSIIIDQLI